MVVVVVVVVRCIKMVVKIKRIHGRLGSILEQLPFPGNGARKLVGIF